MTNDKKPRNEEARAAAEQRADASNGVLVIRKIDDEGNVSVAAVPIGDVTSTEVQTILELGLREWRERIGLA